MAARKKPDYIDPTPQLFPVKNYVTPKQDVVFYVLRDGRIPVNKQFTYGSTFKSHPQYAQEAGLGDHVLCYVEPMDPTGWQKWWYAATRANQDTYNYELRDCQEVIRTYLVPRGDHPPVPAGGTPDDFFADYGFVGVTVKSPGTTLEGIFEVVIHRYIQRVTTDVQYNAALDDMVTITKEVIPKGTGVASQVAGLTVEVQDGNACHDVLISTSCNSEDRTLETLPTFADYNFPDRLNGVDIIYAWAFADSSQAAFSYDEDFFFKFDLTSPKPGPYPAKTYRTVTADPEAIMNTVSLNNVPVPKRETVGMVAAWYVASPKGNRTYAFAKEYVLPASVHTSINIAATSAGGGGTPAALRSLNPTSLATTPGFTGDFTGEIPVAASVRQLPLGMYEVSITKLQLAGGIYA